MVPFDKVTQEMTKVGQSHLPHYQSIHQGVEKELESDLNKKRINFFHFGGQANNPPKNFFQMKKSAQESSKINERNNLMQTKFKICATPMEI